MNSTHIVIEPKCPHCGHKQAVKIPASLGAGGMSPEFTTCEKCNKEFQANDQVRR